MGAEGSEPSATFEDRFMNGIGKLVRPGPLVSGALLNCPTVFISFGHRAISNSSP